MATSVTPRTRIADKILTVVANQLPNHTYKSHAHFQNNTAPSTYLPVCHATQLHTPTRQLRSSSAGLLKRQTTSTKTSDRAFSAAAVKIWNDLPVTIYVLRHHLYSLLGVSRLICLCFRLTDDYPYSGASDSMQHSFELRRR